MQVLKIKLLGVIIALYKPISIFTEIPAPT